jgi:hypothetical protein
MRAFSQLLLATFFVIASQTNMACSGSIRSETPQEPPQSGEITRTSTAEGYTLSIATTCKSASAKCPFRAEISAAPALFELIQKVEYTYIPERTKSPAPITDASTHFRLEAEQMAGEKVYAAVTLRPSEGAPPKVLRIEGTIPFEVEVTPPLPAGLRFEVNYRPWYLTGMPHEPVEYLFKIQLLGEPAALKRIKAVEYRLPADESKRPRISHRVESEFFVEGSMPKTEGVVIIAAIRWQSGESSSHTIPLRPRS